MGGFAASTRGGSAAGNRAAESRTVAGIVGEIGRNAPISPQWVSAIAQWIGTSSAVSSAI